VDLEVLRLGAGELLILKDGAEERQHRGDTADLGLGHGAPGTLQRLGAVGSGDDDLGEHRVERTGNGVPGVHAGVDAHTGPAGPAQGGYGAGGGQDLPVRVLPVEPELEAVPVRGDFGVPQRLTGGDAELLAHQV